MSEYDKEIIYRKVGLIETLVFSGCYTRLEDKNYCINEQGKVVYVGANIRHLRHLSSSQCVRKI